MQGAANSKIPSIFDHVGRNSSTINSNYHDFLMTYDDADGVRELADRHGFATRLLTMKNTHHAKLTELLISRNLDWVEPLQGYRHEFNGDRGIRV